MFNFSIRNLYSSTWYYRNYSHDYDALISLGAIKMKYASTPRMRL